MYNFGIYLSFAVPMVTKNGRQNRLKIEKLSFWTKFKAFRDRYFKNYISARLNAKNSFNMLCVMILLILC